MPSARWYVLDVYNFLQLIENMTPTDCYAIKYAERQSLPGIHSSTIQLSLFTVYLKVKNIFNQFFSYRIVSHSSKFMLNIVAAVVNRKKEATRGGGEKLCAGPLQSVPDPVGTVGLKVCTFQNLC